MSETTTEQRSIPFSPPDITDAEVQAVGEALRSGWITTGPSTKRFEQNLRTFMDAQGVAAFASSTHAAENCLRALGIGPGDEVIVPAYTYTASASVICHVGATPVMVDVLPGTYELDYDAVGRAITARTKAVVPVDLGGVMCDYDRLYAVLDDKRALWHPAPGIQSCFDRVIVVADAAHACGATYKGHPAGSVADFTSFSFHAVKNLTSGEGGALAWRDHGFDSDEFYHQLMLWSLHGQDKDALAKSKAGAWEYDVVFPGYKSNMTDIAAAIGLVQLERYPGLLARRRQLVERYERNLADAPVQLIRHYGERGNSSGHLMLTRIDGADHDQRNAVIEALAAQGVATNVHYKPLPLLTAYRTLGFKMEDYPQAYAQFQNEVTLPLHTLLSDEDVDYVCAAYRTAIAQVMGR